MNYFKDALSDPIIAGGLFVFSFLIVFLSIPTILRITRLKGLLDVPNSRSAHTESVPRLGGIAIFSAVLLASLFIPEHLYLYEFKFLIIGLVILFFLGVKDDIIILDPKKKIVGQFIAAGIVVIFADLRLVTFYDLFGLGEVGYLTGTIISVLFVVTLINGFNLIDGIDGLSSGVGIVASSILTYWLNMNGEKGYAMVSLSLAGALIAFFYFNVISKDKKIFLGDTGAMIIGFLIAVLTLVIMRMEESGPQFFNPTYNPSLLFALVFVPVFDTARVSIKRILNGHSPFKADKRHIHHQIVGLGFSHIKATTIIISVNLILYAIPLLFRNLKTEYLLAGIFIVGLICSILLTYMVFRQNNGHDKAKNY